MQRPQWRISIKRVIVTIVVAVLGLAGIKANYRTPVHLYDARLAFAGPALDDETLKRCADEILSPENLDRAKSDPRLIDIPLRLVAGSENRFLGSSPGEMVVSCLMDRSAPQSLRIMSETDHSQALSKSIADSVIDAYLSRSNSSTHVPFDSGMGQFSTVQTAMLAEPIQVTVCLLVLAVLCLLILMASIPRSLGNRLLLLVGIPVFSIYLLELLLDPFLGHRYQQVDVVVGLAIGSIIGVGACRRPGAFLVLAGLLYLIAPHISHGFNAVTLAGTTSVIGWLIGAPAGYLQAAIRRKRSQTTPIENPKSTSTQVI